MRTKIIVHECGGNNRVTLVDMPGEPIDQLIHLTGHLQWLDILVDSAVDLLHMVWLGLILP